MSGVCTAHPSLQTNILRHGSLEPKLAFFFFFDLLIIIIKKNKYSCQTEPAKGNCMSDTAFTYTDSLKDH